MGDWLRSRLQNFLGIRPPAPLSHVGGIALGTVQRTPEEAAAINYNQDKPLQRIILDGASWRCPAGHKNKSTGTGHANCPQCCWPVHLDN